MDYELYEQTIETPHEERCTTDKDMLYVIDQNNGSYNGQIQFDTSSLSNSGRWLSFSEGYFEIPFVLTMKSSADLTALNVNAFTAGLKSGAWNIIDSIQVDYNNTNVVQLQPFTNFYINYKMLTQTSTSELKKWGQLLNFIPDSAGSERYSAAGTSANGDGISNNVVYPLTAPVYLGGARDAHNAGYYERLKYTSFNATTSPAQVGYGLPTLTTAAQAQNAAKNILQNNAGAAAARVWQWSFLLTIRLKDCADYFDKLPLVKGGFMRFVINYNSFNTQLLFEAAGPPTALNVNAAGITVRSGRTNPIMISSAAANNPFNWAFANVLNAGTVDFSCGVVNCTNSFTTTATLPACRLYVPAYSLTSIKEQALTSLQPVREVIYTDIYNFNISNVSANNSFQQILTNGIVNPKYVIVVPQLNGSQANVGWFAANNNPEYQSPFSSSPATTAPLASITNFNVQIGGRNIFQQNFNYDFETFKNEVVSVNAINGGVVNGLANGLISKYDWDNAYRYYVVDVGRREQFEDISPKSILVQGTNNTSTVMDYFCFVVFERKIKINMLDGSLVSGSA